MKKGIWVVLSLIPAWISAQQSQGRVTVFGEESLPPGIVISVLAPKSAMGLQTQTDEFGGFNLLIPEGIDSIQIAATGGGMRSEAQWLTSGREVTLLLKPQTLHEVDIEDKQRATQLNTIHTIPTTAINAKELGRAACCNLSESFETNATVDVNLSDAVTGAKKIQMLGLDGEYVYLTNELLPGLRGLASSFGMGYIPGPWIHSIQVGKGTGSVAYGYESIAGQINLEWIKPASAEPFFANLYLNHMGRSELNLQFAKVFNPRWSTLALVHGSRVQTYADKNADGIIDLPVTHQINFLNRWKYQGKKREAQVGVRYVFEDRKSGTLEFFGQPGGIQDSSYALWNFATRTHRAELFGKHGFLWTEKCYKSLGLMASLVLHDQVGNYGTRSYKGRQIYGYFNSIYHSRIVNENHQFKVGASFLYDRVQEQFQLDSVSREEMVPGVFGEYILQGTPTLQIISGLRIDYHNLFGVQPTPRFHAKWTFAEGWNWRVSAGSGFRVPNYFADHSAMLISGRKIELPETLEMEKAWSFGNGLVWEFPMGKQTFSIGADIWYTHFENRLLVDREAEGKLWMRFSREPAYSLVCQFDADLPFTSWIDLRLGYKYQKVEAMFGGLIQQEALVPQHRGLSTISLNWNKVGLQFDLTSQFIGPARIPEANDLISGQNRAGYSPFFMLWFSQLSWKTWKDNTQKPRIEWYIGMENMFNYTQPNPILNPHVPGSEHFDGALAWGPVFGRMVYGGIRFWIR
jgi:outer membrane receptor for ferrienterochelin and colicins